MLAINNISKCYKNKSVLKNVTLTLNQGIYGLLGENGAGKTTLINILTGLSAPDSGEVLYNDINIKKENSNYRKQLGYMPQYATYYPNFTANEFMRYMCTLKGISREKQKTLIGRLLQEVNLYEECNNKIGTFSGGMRQRLGIAQAMINNPDVLILDEPTAGLDPRERIRFRELISNLGLDRTILLATHIIPDIEQIANQVIIMHLGEIMIMGDTKSLLAQKEREALNLEELFLLYTQRRSETKK